MPRRISLSQLRSKLRQAEQKRRRKITKYNQEVRRYNQKVRAHNARVRANRRRLKNELARLSRNSKSAVRTRYVVYHKSVTTLYRSYEQLDTYADVHELDARYNRLLDLSERETANSLEVRDLIAFLVTRRPATRRRNRWRWRSFAMVCATYRPILIIAGRVQSLR